MITLRDVMEGAIRFYLKNKFVIFDETIGRSYKIVHMILSKEDLNNI